ncbi:MAG: NfeD family protein [Clostridia bacterium]|nr:NfeD family protein [Clostridia bacterium]
MWQIWLIIAILFFILEMMGPGFLLFWVGVGALIAMVVSFFIDNIAIQIGVFTISSIALLFCTRPFANKFAKTDNTVTNAKSVIGKKGIVTKQINSLKGTGQIKVGGESWTAKSSNEDIIEEGAQVTILDINGVKAIVEKTKDKTTEVENV